MLINTPGMKKSWKVLVSGCCVLCSGQLIPCQMQSKHRDEWAWEQLYDTVCICTLKIKYALIVFQDIEFSTFTRFRFRGGGGP